MLFNNTTTKHTEVKMSNKIQTPMQEFIDYLELTYGSLDEYIKEIYLEKEKKAIAKAFDDGEGNNFYERSWIINGKAYYDKKYGNKD